MNRRFLATFHQVAGSFWFEKHPQGTFKPFKRFNDMIAVKKTNTATAKTNAAR